MLNISIKKLSSDAIVPMKANGDAGYDLYSAEEYILQPLERKLFKTNIAMSIPYGYYGRIADRSGNAFKRGLHVMGGVIDSTYRGDIGVILVNLNRLEPGNEDYCTVINKGDRIAQIIFEKYNDAKFVEVEELDQTIRNDSGFGSSGN